MPTLRLRNLTEAFSRRLFSTSGLVRTFNAGKISPFITKLLKSRDITITEKDCQAELRKPLLDVLHDRGLIKTCINEDGLRKIIATKKSGVVLRCRSDC